MTFLHIIKLGATEKLDSENIESLKLKQAEICFSSLKNKAMNESVEIETKILVSKSIPETILEESSDGDYSLIVMGSQGLTGLKKIVLGSVTEKVLKKSTIPVLVVR